MSISKENQRVSARVPTHVYETLAHAADLMGATLNNSLYSQPLKKLRQSLKMNA